MGFGEVELGSLGEVPFMQIVRRGRAMMENREMMVMLSWIPLKNERSTRGRNVIWGGREACGSSHVWALGERGV